MSFPLTAFLAATALGLSVFCGWQGARPPDPHRGPRLAPYRFLMLLFAAGFMVMLVHLVNLAGFSTGRN